MSNDQVIDRGIAKAKELIDAQMLRTLKATAYDLLASTDVPVWTHNLWDSIGCGIYRSGVLIEYATPVRGAKDPRSGAESYPMEARTDRSSFFNSSEPIWGAPSGVDVNREYWGEKELFDMLNDAPPEISGMTSGWALYYVAAMPYAQVLDEDYNVLKDELVNPLFFSHIVKL